MNIFDENIKVPLKSRDDSDVGKLVTLCEVVRLLSRCESGDCDGDGDGDSKTDGLYVKDWHASRTVSDLYKVPLPLADDWLDWFWRQCRGGEDDYRFVYVGGQGSATSLHHDVVYSCSWSVNFSGEKQWTFYRPDDSKPFAPPPPSSSSSSSSPHSQPMQVRQGVHEVIFVPSGWYHSVVNVVPSEVTRRRDSSPPHICLGSTGTGVKTMDATLSVNQNWFNGFNVYQVWRFLCSELRAIRKELWHLKSGTDASRDCPELSMEDSEWVNHCEVLLRANARLNVAEFIELMASRYLDILSLDARPHEWATEASWGILLCTRFLETLRQRSEQAESKATDLDVFRRPCLSLHEAMRLHSTASFSQGDEENPDDGVGDEEQGVYDVATQCVSLTDVLATLVNNDVEDVEVSIWVFGALQVLRIIEEMLSCPVLNATILPALFGGRNESVKALHAFRIDMRDYVSKYLIS